MVQVLSKYQNIILSKAFASQHKTITGMCVKPSNKHAAMRTPSFCLTALVVLFFGCQHEQCAVWAALPLRRTFLRKYQCTMRSWAWWPACPWSLQQSGTPQHRQPEKRQTFSSVKISRSINTFNSEHNISLIIRWQTNSINQLKNWIMISKVGWFVSSISN